METKKVFLICPVRKVTQQERTNISYYIERLEEDEHQVHWPERDTDQKDDPTGLRICSDNFEAISKADEVHVWWNKTSSGSLFDLGMAFALDKKIVLANEDDIDPTETKSFNNFLLAINRRRRTH